MPPPLHRETVRRIIFEHDTRAGRAFDVILIVAILLSVLVVMLDSVPSIGTVHGSTLMVAEWGFTILFSVEYLLRVWSTPRKRQYATSFYGIIDLLSVIPTYLSIFFPTGRFIAVIRILRVLRIFRVLKLAQYVQEAGVLTSALRASRFKIIVFVFSVLNLVVVAGALMYLVEGADAGFTSIPQSVYWAVVTITTVGYGDIAPATTLGRVIASALMIMGYGIIAVPTGIVTLELQRAARSTTVSPTCPRCGAGDHAPDALFCRSCGERLPNLTHQLSGSTASAGPADAPREAVTIERP